ncbi:hypothetical protein HOV23_gp060 [Pseudomonas phage Lana]|uniref:Uncharacterized protein n=1 Tax=Pseudomonas phage Lana TaxID=2530172 RepID=A0A481W6D1_9CAUD|nr:hypothetical protein HOV23_gp060 [Pseudomonas phage Lana]QBJ04513.1 hypothetical protein [Pseudomonas phage Lana]
MDHEGTVLQPLDQCLSDYRTRKGYNEMTFTTEMTIDSASVLRGGMRPEKFGLVIWMDRDKATALLGQKTPSGMQEEHAGPLRSLMLALQHVQAVGAAESISPNIDLNSLLDRLLLQFGAPQ